MEEQIQKPFGVRNEAEHKRKARVRAKQKPDHADPKQPSPGHIHQAFERFPQRAVNLIRWL